MKEVCIKKLCSSYCFSSDLVFFRETVSCSRMCYMPEKKTAKSSSGYEEKLQKVKTFGGTYRLKESVVK